MNVKLSAHQGLQAGLPLLQIHSVLCLLRVPTRPGGRAGVYFWVVTLADTIWGGALFSDYSSHTASQQVPFKCMQAPLPAPRLVWPGLRSPGDMSTGQLGGGVNAVAVGC